MPIIVSRGGTGQGYVSASFIQGWKIPPRVGLEFAGEGAERGVISLEANVIRCDRTHGQCTTRSLLLGKLQSKSLRFDHSRRRSADYGPCHRSGNIRFPE